MQLSYAKFGKVEICGDNLTLLLLNGALPFVSDDNDFGNFLGFLFLFL